MHRVDGAGNVAGMYTDGTPGVQEATVLTADWHNAVQEELVNAIEDMGGVLSKPDNTQLETGLRATYGAKGTTNTWELAQTFQGNVTIQSTGALDVDGNSTLGTNAANTQTFNGVSTFNAAATFSENTSFAAGKTATFSGTVDLSAATATMGAWQAAATGTYGSHWSVPAFDAPFTFRALPWGYVQLRGGIENNDATTPGTVVFTLPTGYRPSVKRYVVIPTNTAAIFCAIDTDGTINIRSADVTIGMGVHFDGISFPL